MNNFIDRFLTHPILDWIAQATLVLFVVGVIIATCACFVWGVA
jgi:hypothetical protein